MEFDLDADQDSILSAVGAILDRHAGPVRMRALGGDDPRYDRELEALLGERGFLDLVDGAHRRLEAALVVEAVATGLGVIAAAARALVAPALGEDVPGPIAVVAADHRGPARFLADAATVVVIDTHEVRLIHPEPGSTTRTRSRLGWPMGRLVDGADAADPARIAGGRPIAVDPGVVRSWWRLAIAAEVVGTMRAAMAATVEHVTQRKQFDRAIGSFQGVQHRLAECAVAVESSRWLVLEAAWRGAPAEAAAAALTQALVAAPRVFGDTHQFHGALGFTTEYDLHLWTMRLPALRIEAEALGRPATALATERWKATPTTADASAAR